MPTPTPGETKQEFISRCIPTVIEDGTAQDVSQAAAICYSMFDRGAAGKSLGGLTVIKSADGGARWVAVSSSAYQDREGEIVSRAALEKAVAYNYSRNYFGPLRWWHVGGVDLESAEAADGLDIGDCDFAMVYGKFLVESGTFRKPEYAAALKDYDGQISIGFLHAESEPDAEGVYHNIVIYERSVLPNGRAANPFTALATQTEGEPMTDRVKEFVDLFGDADFASGVLAQLEAQQRRNDEAGIKSKSADNGDADGLLKKLKSLLRQSSAEKQVDEPDGEMGGALGEPVAANCDGLAEMVADVVVAKLVDAGIVAQQEPESDGVSDAIAEDTEKAVADALANALKRIEALEGALADAKKELDELTGAGGGYRPTRADDNLITDVKAAPDGMADFLSRIGG